MAFPEATQRLKVVRKPTRTDLPGGVSVWTFADQHSSHLLVSKNESVLIDCHDPGLREEIEGLGLPVPGLILHTHIQPGHCREGGVFSHARIRVHKEEEVLAFDPARVCRMVANQSADLARWPVDFGREPFGVAGCQTEFPPEVPLLSEGVTGGGFEVGEFFRCGAVELRVIDLAFHGRHAVGFVISDSERGALGIFIGDLFRRGPFLVDASSLVENYVASRLPRLPALLDQLQEYGDLPLFPAAGLPIKNGTHEITILKARVQEYLDAQQVSPAVPPRPEPKEIGKPGRLREIAKGIYNMGNAGNTIALIDKEGHALMVDPGPCDFENEQRDRDFIADLATLESAAGLKTVDYILITHFHGDHIDRVHRVRERYPECKVATWAAVAEVMEFPERFNYSARLPWYGLEVKSVPVDIKLGIGESLEWRGHSIQVVHLPGHALVHCGFVLSFNGERLAITGDSIQGNGEADSLNPSITNHSAPNESEGLLGAYRQLARIKVDLNLGGHGSWFRDCARVYEESIIQIATQQAALERLFMPGSVRDAFVSEWIGLPPGGVPPVRSEIRR
jgi:glyoxylase-like metal-dependent hydrolase (beta-lactamase superfamily II)